MNDSGPLKPSAHSEQSAPDGTAPRVRLEGMSTAPAQPSSASQDARVAEGTTVGRFVLERKLGEGGMGLVFAAHDPSLQRQVAVKIVRPAKDEAQGTEAQQRMLREAQAMAMVSHPNLVTIYEVGTFEDDVFLAMEYVVGATLDRWLAAGQALEDVLEVFAEAGRALQAVHDAGLVHRDFKPANVMVREDGVAKVLDLGIARKTGSAGERPQETGKPSSIEAVMRPPELGADAFESVLTEQGALVGTPSYMSPEQLRGQDVGPHSDQFSFAVALYEALAGQRPFGGGSDLATMTRILTGEVRPWPDGALAPKALRKVVQRALSTEPGARYESMTALLSALQKALGLRGQIRFLTSRWQASGRRPDYLLAEGELLREGRLLLSQYPDTLSDPQRSFVERSAAAARKRLLQRRALLWGLAAVTVGLIPSVWMLDRRSQQLERATRAGVRAGIDGVEEKVESLFEAASSHLTLMYEQRGAWLPNIDSLVALAEPHVLDRDPQLTELITRLNHFFRPVVEQAPIVSSLMVARADGFEFLVFDDPDAGRLVPPYRLYNRLVQRRGYGTDAYQVFWPTKGSLPPRSAWLRMGEVDSRGQRWNGYDPTARPWFVTAQAKPAEVTWTKPYLFFVTKDAGITGSVGFEHAGQRYVLAVDFMLTDLSAITAGLEDDRFWAMVTTGGDRVVGLPSDPRFRSTEDIRDFFARMDTARRLPHAKQKRADVSAELPSVSDLDHPVLTTAHEAAKSTKDAIFSFEYGGQSYWAGRRRIASPEQDLTLYVVEKPEAHVGGEG